MPVTLKSFSYADLMKQPMMMNSDTFPYMSSIWLDRLFEQEISSHGAKGDSLGKRSLYSALQCRNRFPVRDFLPGGGEAKNPLEQLRCLEGDGEFGETLHELDNIALCICNLR